MLSAKNVLSLRCHVGELRPIRTDIRHLVGDDEMMLRIHGDLHVIADNTRAAPACRH
jgi:hypothetical protein